MTTNPNANTRHRPRLSWGQRLGWAMGDYGSNLYWQSISLFLYFFYTDVMGISPVWAGVSFAVGSIYDAVSDPIMGSIADRTRTRWGRYRPYILLGAIPATLAFAASFYVPPLSGLALVVYATLTHILMRTFYTVINIPYIAMAANISSDSGERATLAGLRMVFAALGAITIAVGMPKLTGALTQSGYAQPYFIAAALIGAIASVVFFACFFSTKENTFADAGASKAMTLGDLGRDFYQFWGTLKRNTPLARVFGAIVVVSISLTMFSKCVLYWFKYGLARPDLIWAGLMLPALMLFICAPFWVWFAKRYSKRQAWMFGSIFAAIGYICFYFNQSTSIAVTLGFIALIGVGTSAYAIMFWAMLPDTVEYNEWQLGERNEAKAVGFAAFAQKAALAVNAILLGQLLEWVGYVANQALSAAAIGGIKAMMCFVPLLGVALSVWVLWKYPITPKFYEEMMVALSERDQKKKASPSAE